jgi:hypothetical protein
MCDGAHHVELADPAPRGRKCADRFEHELDQPFSSALWRSALPHRATSQRDEGQHGTMTSMRRQARGRYPKTAASTSTDFFF